jgi:nucleoside transporter
MKVRLMVMMFLQFFIWGAWYATGGNYMKSHGMTDVIYLAYMASPIGSIVSPFFMGMMADRFFPVQRVMGMMHILSGIFIFSAPLVADTSTLGVPYFLVFLLLHMLCYMPTVGLATATAFHLLTDKEREFPLVRMFGTCGWIAAGFVVSYLLKGDTTSLPMHVSGIGGVLMGFYSFTLPHVPPPGAGKKFSFRDIAGIDALRQLSARPFNIFIAGLLLISIPFASYFAYVPLFLKAAHVESPAFKMTFGQMSEIIFLLLLPWFFRKFGLRRVLILGFTAWTLRYALFAFGGPAELYWMFMVAILLHGACYDFVYVAGQVYIDKSAPTTIRAQAQGLFVLVSYGVGQGLGTLGAGWIFNRIMDNATEPSLEQWQAFWTVPLVFAAVVTVMFSLGFDASRSRSPESS